MTKTKLPEIGKRYKNKFLADIVKVLDVQGEEIIYRNIKLPVSVPYYPDSHHLRAFWEMFEELPPEKPSCDHPEIFKGPRGCTYGKCDGVAEKPAVKEILRTEEAGRHHDSILLKAILKISEDLGMKIDPSQYCSKENYKGVEVAIEELRKALFNAGADYLFDESDNPSLVKLGTKAQNLLNALGEQNKSKTSEKIDCAVCNHEEINRPLTATEFRKHAKHVGREDIYGDEEIPKNWFPKEPTLDRPGIIEEEKPLWKPKSEKKGITVAEYLAVRSGYEKGVEDGKNEFLDEFEDLEERVKKLEQIVGRLPNLC